MSEKQKQPTRRSSGLQRALFAASGVVTTLPFAMAFVSAALDGGSMFDETGAGAYLWLAFLSIPCGAAIAGVAFTVILISRHRHRGR